MPGYKTHRNIALAFCPFVAAGTWLVLGGHARADMRTWQEVKAALLVGGGIYIGNTWLTPDLDIVSGAYNAWGPLKLLWLPYQVMVKHRSPKSHWPILGVVLQHIYLFLAITLLAALVIVTYNFVLLPYSDFGPRLYDWRQIPIRVWQVFGTAAGIFAYPEYWIVLAGNIVGALVHFAVDKIDSARKKRDAPEQPELIENEAQDYHRH